MLKNLFFSFNNNTSGAVSIEVVVLIAFGSMFFFGMVSYLWPELINFLINLITFI